MACSVKQQCSKKLVTLLRWLFFGGAVIFAALSVLFIIFIDSAAASLPMALALFSAWLGVRYAPLYYKSLSYARGRSFFSIERGVFWRKTIMIPNTKIEYVDYSRDPFERLAGIGTLIFFTTGGKVRLRGIQPQDAQRLRSLFSKEDDR
ncbi:MAG: PH domain-containing protein [Clostridia bacterium]|nr:PH domain-containing protein [Clostridia bacterium]